MDAQRIAGQLEVQRSFAPVARPVRMAAPHRSDREVARVAPTRLPLLERVAIASRAPLRRRARR
jgi:hypothetical protein